MGRVREAVRDRLPPALVDSARRIKDVRGYLDVHHRYGARSVPLKAVISAYFRPRKTILFYPERPSRAAIVYKLCAVLGYAITTDPNHRFHVAFQCMDATFFGPRIPRSGPPPADRTVNSRSTDISKRAVSAAFTQTFGYGCEIDPARYAGEIVEKSNENARHDGRILQGPVAPTEVDPASVYQKVIDNRSATRSMVVDYRVPVHGTRIPLVYLKYRPVESRFSNLNSRVELRNPDSLLSRDEQRMLLSFARRMGVDFGELDVLRDVDGRIYVVDVNNTPAGPPNGLPVAESRRALARMAISFDQMLSSFCED